jgi:tRNA-specific 2-thiouridylase
MAAEFGYPELAKKSESYEICFVPDNDYRGFLKKKVAGLEEKIAGGHFLDKSGKVLGQHKGYPFYTIGQRKGLEVTFGKPMYVTGIDALNNSVVLGDEEDLNSKFMTVAGINWMKYDSVAEGQEAITKIRYKDAGSLSQLYPNGNNINVIFSDPVKSIAPGQSAVFYEGEDVIGGGIIQRGASPIPL